MMDRKHEQQICHPGVVDRIVGRTLFVKIESQAACGNCRAKSYCGMVESVDKVVEVVSDRAADFTVGQKVDIVLERSLGYKALLMGYMVPFLILIVSLFAMYLLTGSEGLSALVAVLLMAPYYALLYHFRETLRETFRFHIRTI